MVLNETKLAPANTQTKNIKWDCRMVCRGMYGISGNGCKYCHPKPCKKLLNHGIRGTNGCEKGNQCEFLHPRMCHNSLFKKACFNSQCKDRHIRGTWKKVPGDGNIHPRPQNDRQTDANEHDPHIFFRNNESAAVRHAANEHVNTKPGEKPSSQSSESAARPVLGKASSIASCKPKPKSEKHAEPEHSIRHATSSPILLINIQCLYKEA